MLKTESALNVIGKLVDKLKIKEVIVSLLIAGIFILFAPDRFINTLGLEVWRETYMHSAEPSGLRCVSERTLCGT